MSEEQNVSAVMTKVRSGEADAGLVYVTDVRAAGGAVDGIRPAGADSVVNDYPIAVLAGSDNPVGAKAFVRWVRSHGRPSHPAQVRICETMTLPAAAVRHRRGRGTIPWGLRAGFLGLALLILPILGLISRADWPRVPAAITSPEAVNALSRP